ncbi:hypothetical protein FSST1_002084 [Fusarium sambucinum]
MEVVSPVLADIPTDWENVVDVLSILRNNFRLFVPNSCGFHIHIAKGNEKLPLHLLRKVVVLMACAESMIFSLCHPVRKERLWSRPIMGEWSPLHENYEKGARLQVTPDFWLYIPLHPGSNPRLLGALKKLWMANTGRRLQRLLKPDIGKCCISLSKCDFDSAVDTEYNATVEFRFLEGTLDPELIVRWGQLTIALFKFADIAPLEAWPVFLNTVLQCQPSGRCDISALGSFLSLLGLSDDFNLWADRVVEINLEERLERKTNMHAHQVDARP